MTDWLPFVVAGLVAGSIYAIAALGLVVTYRTTRLFNFAHGAVGMAVAYGFHELRDIYDVPTPIALVLALGVLAPLLGIGIERFLFRDLTSASQTTKIVLTMGLLIALQGGAVALFGARPRSVEPFLPTSTFDLGGVAVGWDQVVVMAIGLAVLGGLTAFFGSSRVGTAMRAAVDDRDLVRAAGFSTARLGALTWALGAATAGLAGILLSPLLGLDSIILTLLVVQAYAAAVAGRLTSLPLTFAGALVVGLAQNLALNAFADHPGFLNGLRPSIPFLLLFALLVFSPRGRLRELGSSAPWAGSLRAGRTSWRPLLFLVPLVLVLSEARVFSLGAALVLACALLGLTLLTGTSGLISLAHAGLVGTGAFAYIHLMDAGVPFPLALLGAGCCVVPLGLLIAIPALRLSGMFLALATFGFGQLIDGLLFGSWTWLSGGADGIRGGRPSALDDDRAYVLFVVAMVVLLSMLITRVRGSGLGRTLLALRDSPAAADALGVDPLWPRVAIFTVAAFVAGVAGGLYAGLLEAASPTYFSSFTSLLWLTLVVVGGIESPLGAVAGALLYAFVPELLSGGGPPSPWLAPLFGVAAILLARRPGGVVGWLGERWPRRLVAVRGRDDDRVATPSLDAAGAGG